MSEGEIDNVRAEAALSPFSSMLPPGNFQVRHASWSSTFKRWDDEMHFLPENPFARHRKGGPLPLCPQRFLRDLPTVDPSDFWSWSWENYNQELRNTFKYDISSSLKTRETKRIARRRPDLAVSVSQGP